MNSFWSGYFNQAIIIFVFKVISGILFLWLFWWFFLFFLSYNSITCISSFLIIFHILRSVSILLFLISNHLFNLLINIFIYLIIVILFLINISDFNLISIIIILIHHIILNNHTTIEVIWLTLFLPLLTLFNWTKSIQTHWSEWFPYCTDWIKH